MNELTLLYIYTLLSEMSNSIRHVYCNVFRENRIIDKNNQSSILYYITLVSEMSNRIR